jgi:hypothetical protein
LTTTVERGSRATGAPASRDRVIARIGFWTIAIIAVIYAPLAINYTWHLFSGDAPHLQRALDTAVNGSAYESGPQSVNAVRTADYTHHRVIMLVHTTLGGIALLLALFQFNPRLRARNIALHRWTGRVYLVLMTTSMLTAITFLSLASIIHINGGRAFDLQLWGLALGTLATAAVAFLAIRAKDVVTHRAWMAMNLSLMMTAPLLRVGWIGMGRLSDSPLLDNLGYSSIALGIVAPAGGVFAFMFTARVRRRDRAVPQAGSAAAYVGIVLLAIAGAVAVVRVGISVISGSQQDGIWFHAVPALAYAGFCVVQALRSRAGADPVREQAWRWLALGGATSSFAALAAGVALWPVIGIEEGLITGVMLGSVGPIVATWAYVVFQSAKWPQLAKV